MLCLCCCFFDIALVVESLFRLWISICRWTSLFVVWLRLCHFLLTLFVLLPCLSCDLVLFRLLTLLYFANCVVVLWFSRCPVTSSLSSYFFVSFGSNLFLFLVVFRSFLPHFGRPCVLFTVCFLLYVCPSVGFACPCVHFHCCSCLFIFALFVGFCLLSLETCVSVVGRRCCHFACALVVFCWPCGAVTLFCHCDCLFLWDFVCVFF